ncbi:MAG: hypothetical protein H6622_01825 [Halobacteriovoraceae bacterium]|nr:hypothetical protein [Halobacteriovoraceae bacterium]
MLSLIEVFFIVIFTLQTLSAAYFDISKKEKLEEYSNAFLTGISEQIFDDKLIFASQIKLKALGRYQEILGEDFEKIIKMCFIKEIGGKHISIQQFDFSRSFITEFEKALPEYKKKFSSQYHKWFIQKIYNDLYLIGKSPLFTDLQIKMDTIKPVSSQNTLKFKKKADLIFNWGNFLLRNDTIDIKVVIDKILLNVLEKTLLFSEIYSGLTYNQVLSVVISPSYSPKAFNISISTKSEDEKNLSKKINDL